MPLSPFQCFFLISLGHMRRSSMKEKKKSVNITLDASLIDLLKERAALSDRSFSSYINLLLRKYLSRFLPSSDQD